MTRKTRTKGDKRRRGAAARSRSSRAEAETATAESPAPDVEVLPDGEDLFEDGETTPEQALVPAPSGALALPDALSAYMREVGRYPLLTAEEERGLGARARQGDVDAALQLATSNLRLVVSVAMRYRSTWSNLLDLIQEGNVGLMKAIEKFDPHRGLRFSTYATWWIKAYMLKYLLDNWSLVRIGTSNARRKAFFNVKKERERLRLRGIEPTAARVAARLDVSEKDVVEVGHALDAKDVSLDAPVQGEAGTEAVRALPARQPPPDEVVAEEESRRILKEQFARFATTLPERERRVFTDRLAAEDPLTLQELADIFGMTREGMRQVEKRVVARFRRFVEGELAEYDLDLGPGATGDDG